MTVVTNHQPLVRLMDQQVLIRVLTRWLRLGLFQSIRPTINYQPGKANVVPIPLNRFQRNTTEDSTMIKGIVTEDNDEISALNGSKIELLEGDILQWTKVYEADSSFKIVLSTLPRERRHKIIS